MRKAMPPMTEPADDLKQRRRREPYRHQPLQLLSRLARGQAHARQEVVQLPGLHRNTIGRWLAMSAAGGLPALLAPDVLTSLAQAPPSRRLGLA